MSPTTEDEGNLRETLGLAIETSMRPQEAIRATDEDTLNLAVEPFNKHATALGLKYWIVDRDMLSDSTTLFQRLPVLEKMLTQMSCEVSAVEDAPSDDQVVARASGGAALFGHCFGYSGSSRGIETAILQPPAECELEAPTISTGTIEVWFASAGEAKDFGATVQANGCAETPTDACYLPRRGSAVAHMTYARAPLKSFELAAMLAPLTESAMAEAASITDEATAKDFLLDYGSHVRSGIFHVGGIFWKTVHISTDVDVMTAQLKAKCPAGQAPDDLSINYSSFPDQSRVDACESTLEDELRTPCNITTQIECTGPDAMSVAIFKQRLALDRATWHVIDYPTTRVRVWDLLAAAGCDRAATLVCDAWLDLVEESEMTPDVEAAVHAVYTEAWLHDSTFGTNSKRTSAKSAKKAAQIIAKQLNAATTGNIDSKALVDAILLALRFDTQFERTFLVDCMQDPRLHTALRRLVAANDMMAMLELGAIYAHVLGTVLAEAGINLDATVDEALKRAGQLAELKKVVNKLLVPLYEWSVPQLDARDVPIALKLVHGAFFEAAMPDGAQLTSRVAELIARHHFPPAPGHHELWSIAQKFGCSEDGVETSLSAEHVLAMADEVMLTLNGSAMADSSDDEASIVTREFVPEADEPMSSTIEVQQPMSHLLTHRLSLVKELYNTTSGIKRKRVDRRARDESPRSPVVFDALLSLVASLTPTARAEVYRLLLDRRCLVPFLVPSTEDGLRTEARALSLVETRIVQGKASLMRDTSVKRVAVISERPTKSSVTKDWIKNVFHVDSVHCLDRTHGNNVTDLPVVAELGWGFVQENTEFTTVMVLHIIGDYMPLAPFITQFTDVLLIDTVSKPVRMTLPRGTVLHWRLSDEDEDDTYLDDKTHMVSVALACPMSSSCERISEYILDEPSDAPKLPVDQLPLPSLVKRDPLLRARVASLLADTDFTTLRTETLVLQRRFAHESALRIALQRETSVPNQEMLRRQIALSAADHKKVFRFVSRTPLLEYFLHVLRLPAVEDREMRIIDLERRLAESCEAITAVARDECSRAFAARSDNDNEDTRSAYASALETWSNMVTGLEHLWRELSHIFTANPDAYANLPHLAVKHLLDGFPLELMDGDAGMLNDKWIRAVLHCLDETLPEGTRVFVLSVMGVQSSGKSTLLNCMFGVRLRTRVSRCTCGFNLQLIACDNGAVYDYILLLDTEGTQSPEYVGMEGTVWRDNRMASVAILPADATIILTKGEATNTINDVLPIVLSAFANSELAAASGGHLMSKLYFAFNQIDVTQTSSMATSLRALLDSLRSSAKQIAAVRQSQLSTTTMFLRDFHTDITNEARCDVRFLGLTQGQTTPPNDVPLPDFGDRLVRFRDHMHTRATNDVAWQARTLGELGESLDLVWMYLQSANFELDFASAHERIVYDQLVQAMAGHTQELAKIYSDTFDAVLQTISADSAADQAPDASRSRKYEILLEHHVENAVATLDAVDTWTDKKQRQASHLVRLVQSKVQHLFEFDAITKVYKEEIQTAIVDYNSKCGPKKTMAAFDSIFDDILDKARKAKPPLATQVPTLVRAVIHSNHIFTPDELRLLTGDDDYGSWLQGVVRFTSKMLQGAKASREEDIVDAVRERVCSSLAEVDRYSDDVALSCVMSVKRLFNSMQLKQSELRVGLRTLYMTLKTELQQRQERWDTINSVVAKFEAYRPSMHRFAQSVCEGQEAAQLLSTTLNEWLDLHLLEAFEEEVVSIVASALKDARWVRVADAMQAALDMDLLQLMRKREIDIVLNRIDDPVEHAAAVTRRLVLAKVQECYLGVANKLAQDVEESIVSASAAARDAVSKRSEVFVHALRLTLQSRLKCSGTSALIESLPSAAGDVMNCDDQGPSVFALTASRDGLSVPQSLQARLTALDARLTPSAGLSSTMAWEVVKVIQTEAYGAVDGIMPRCGKPCPRCKCPCIKALGHVYTKDDALHDTYHQPGGLVGVSWVKTRELVESSCATSVVENDYIELPTGSRPYTEFETIFPGWALPRVTKFLPLREYIFAQCQFKLARKYTKLKCANIPASYANALGDLEKQLERLLR
ncbi:hypothetical protein SDRG_05685 [Saprolegnia diclina VS20]|uniref:VLIG-type G domain-containing protein n=1 Tax=Saprolegnia diclina (strain VS20) TaxID=1156394 RepID=T0QS79_SAPDV|nr:hypothetical protein SDRG_05685 [Saprolegnia diclina VS20]EQC36855.1 hypothetical protein SDRG_05685 [Saprolegnia diclina VS20]|eukprot:XP_008609636.1 hypothetical protein SDRG_05685 [Saprolegnia diclina VS20]